LKVDDKYGGETVASCKCAPTPRIALDLIRID
jgi:hypothetical protein